MALQPESPPARVAVIGGGLAGLAAAVAAREHGLDVELFEARSRLGGRAGSFRDPQSGELLDHCQHVAMGCCTNLADFCRRTGIADCFRQDRKLWFIGRDGRVRPFAAIPLLPSPLHLGPAMLRLGYLSLGDRLRIGRTLLHLAREADREDVSAESWLRARGQSRQALEQFWSVVLVSALSETLDRVSLAAARKVFVDGFLASRRAYEVCVPRVPLGEIYDRRLTAWLASRGVGVHLGMAVESVEGDARGATEIVLRGGVRKSFDYFVVALPWRTAPGVLSQGLRQAVPAIEELRRIEPAPITAVHLWYDRPIMPLPHAVIVGRLSQWIFQHGDLSAEEARPRSAHYYQVVISASRELKQHTRDEVVSQVCDELAEIWPAARGASLLRWRMVTMPEAVFCAGRGTDRLRPSQQTPVSNLLLAGDWTATGWPATMEGAVRSGYLAVEAILQSLGRPNRVLAADLPRSWLARWLLRAPWHSKMGGGRRRIFEH